MPEKGNAFASQYSGVELPYNPGQITTNLGGNALEMVDVLKTMPQIKRIVGTTRKKKDIPAKLAAMSAKEEQHKYHHHPGVNIVDIDVDRIYEFDETERYDFFSNLRESAYSQFWVNFKGVNIETALKTDPDFIKKAAEEGVDPRYRLTVHNQKPALKDAVMDLVVSPNSIYLMQGNPTLILLRQVNKLYKYIAKKRNAPEVKAKKAISTATMPEVNRLYKLYGQRFKFSMDDASCAIIGGHGEDAVAIEKRFLIGGASAKSCAQASERARGGDPARAIADYYKILTDFKSEAPRLTQLTGETPVTGGILTAEAIKCIMANEVSVLPIGQYHEQVLRCGVNDVAIGLPTLVGGGMVGEIIEADGLLSDMSDDEMLQFDRSVAPIKLADKNADKIASGQKMYEECLKLYDTLRDGMRAFEESKMTS
ncbi:L-lactate dehydrogenase [uncultured archaeon]|nr:L-lactate dehydrogenase [uncultured archaeon]